MTEKTNEINSIAGNGTIKAFPKMERPREKMGRNGVSSLSNAELLAILLGSGTRGVSALALAEQILEGDGMDSIRFTKEEILELLGK